MARFDGIRWIFSHGGGTLPFLADRIREIERFKPEIVARYPKGIVQRLTQLYCDTASASSAPQLAAITQFFPPSQILFGSDHPVVALREGFENIEHFPMIPQARADIYRNNALKLLAS